MFKNTYRIILLLAVFGVFFTSCNSKRDILFNTERDRLAKNTPVFVVQEGSDTSYTREQILQPGDLLVVRNLQNDVLISGTGAGGGNNNIQVMNQSQNMTYRIEADSSVLLPVIGKAKLGGLTLKQAQDELNILYKRDLLKDPIITVSVTNLQVTFLGEFGRQGNFFLNKDQIHLVQMLGEAGGINTRADKRKVKIIRGDINNPEIIIVNLEDINSLSDSRLYLRNNDIIYARARSGYHFLDRITPATSLIGGAGLSILNIYLLIANLTK